MNRTLIAFVLCSLSTLSASGLNLYSPTQQYQDNIGRIHQCIQDAISAKAEIIGQLAFLRLSNQHDTLKPESAELVDFQHKKAVIQETYFQALTNLKKKIKRLKQEEKRLMSFQVN